jgi:tetratricopeptide (TPR) repeat protein
VFPLHRRSVAVALLTGLTACRKPAATAPASGEAAPPAAAAPVARTSAAFEDLRRQAEGARDAGRLADAIDLYRQALEQRPDWTEGEWVQGLMLYQLKRHAEARDVFQRVVLRTPEHGRSWAMKGLCEFELGRYDVARADLDRGAERGMGDDPRAQAVARYHHALLLTRAGDFEPAFRILKELLPMDPQAAPLVAALGINLLRLRALPGELAAEQHPVVEGAGRAGALMLTQKRAEARAEFAALAKRFARVPNVHYAFGAFLITEEPDLALEEFQRELRLSPEHVAARLQVALEYLKRGEAAKALSFAREAAQREPRNAKARSTYGRALEGTGAIQDAIAELEAGVALDSADAPVHLALSKAYAKAGRAEDAARARARFLELTQVDTAS